MLAACGGNSTNNYITNIISGEAKGYTFFEYSLFDKPSSGVLVDSNGVVKSRWERSIIDSTSSKVTWDGKESEVFYWDKNWIYLDKYIDSVGRQYDQLVTNQVFCQYGTCTTISTSGKQKYAPVQTYGSYSLDTTGYIIAKDDTLGKKIEFRHFQKVTPDVLCANPYYTSRTCMIQNETWWDNNQTEFKQKIYRNTWYAKDLGIGFIIEDKSAVPFVLYLK